MNTLQDIILQLKLGTDKGSIHSYIEHFYEIEFKKYKDLPVIIVETGVFAGSSLVLWAEYFSNATIIGIDPKPVMEPLPNYRPETNFNYVLPRYKNISLIKDTGYDVDVLAKIPDIDIFIDDATHEFKDQLFSIDHVLPKMKPGGLFVIEDIRTIEYATTLQSLIPDNLKEHSKVFDFRPIKNRSDDIILAIRIPN
jgi:hypothetical protein